MSATTQTPQSMINTNTLDSASKQAFTAQKALNDTIRDTKKIVDGNIMNILLRSHEEFKASLKQTIDRVKNDSSKYDPEKKLKDIAQLMVSFQEDMFDSTDETMREAAKTARDYFKNETNAKKLVSTLHKQIKKTAESYPEGLIQLVKDLGANESIWMSAQTMSTKQLEQLTSGIISRQMKSVGAVKDFEAEIAELETKTVANLGEGLRGWTANISSVTNIIDKLTNSTDVILNSEQTRLLNQNKEALNQYAKSFSGIDEFIKSRAEELDKLLEENASDTSNIKYKTAKRFKSGVFNNYDIAGTKHVGTVDAKAQNMGNIFQNIFSYAEKRGGNANLNDLIASNETNYVREFAERSRKHLLGDAFSSEEFSDKNSIKKFMNNVRGNNTPNLDILIQSINDNLKLMNDKYSLPSNFKDIIASSGVTTKTQLETLFTDELGKIVNSIDLIRFQYGPDSEIFKKQSEENTISITQAVSQGAKATVSILKSVDNSSKNLSKVLQKTDEEEKQYNKRSVNQKFSNSKFGKILAELTAIFKVFEPIYKNQLSRSNQGLGGTSLASAGIGENSMSRATFMSGVSSSVIAESLKGKAFQAGVLGSTTAYGKMIGSTEGLDNYTRIGNKDDLAKFNTSIISNAQRFGASLKNIEKPAASLRSQFEGFNKAFGTTAEQFTSMMDDITNSDVMPSVMLTTSSWDTMLSQSINRMSELNTAYAKSGVTLDKLNKLREAELRLKTDPLSERMSAAGDLINAANSVGMGTLAPEIQQAFIMQDEKKIEQLVRAVTGGLQESYKNNPHLNVAADAGRAAIMNSPIFQAISSDYNLLKQEKDADKLTAKEQDTTTKITSPGGLGTTVIEIRDLLNRIGGSDIFQVGKDTLVSLGKLGGGMILLGAAQKMLIKMYSLGEGGKAASGLGLGSKIKGLAGRSGGLLRGAGGLAMRGGAGLLRGGLGLLGMINPWVLGAAALGGLGYGAYSLYKNYNSGSSVQATDQQRILTNPRSPNSINNTGNKTYDDLEKAEEAKQKMQEAHLSSLNAIRENTFAMLMALKDLDSSNTFNLSNSSNNTTSVVDPLGKLPTFNNKMNYYSTTNALA